jgi:hypothetical protein
MTMQSPALEAPKLTLPLLVLLAFAACKGSDKDATLASPSAEASASSAATSDDTAAATAAAAEADEPQVGDTGDEYDDADPSALSDFHGALDPHGSWADDGKYGTVWVPSANVVGNDFVPYRTGGHWVYGDDYTWVSDYDWGWAPFHYGRWVSIEGRGWGWIPGESTRPLGCRGASVHPASRTWVGRRPFQSGAGGEGPSPASDLQSSLASLTAGRSTCSRQDSKVASSSALASPKRRLAREFGRRGHGAAVAWPALPLRDAVSPRIAYRTRPLMTLDSSAPKASASPPPPSP